MSADDIAAQMAALGLDVRLVNHFLEIFSLITVLIIGGTIATTSTH